MPKDKALLIDCGGEQFRVVTCRTQGTNGNKFVFNPIRGRNLEYFGKDLLIGNMHVTVWNTGDGKHFIHLTYTLEDPEVQKIDYVALVTTDRTSFATPILGATATLKSPWPSADSDRVRRRYSTDFLPSYKDFRETLAVCYVVTTAEGELPCLKKNGIGLHVVKYPDIKLGIYFTFINLPALLRSRITVMSTSTVRVNGDMSSVLQAGGERKHSIDDVEAFVGMHMSRLIEGHIHLSLESYLHLHRTPSALLEKIVNSHLPLEELRSQGEKRINILDREFLLQPSIDVHDEILPLWAEAISRFLVEDK